LARSRLELLRSTGSPTAVNDKLNGVEPKVSTVLVRETPADLEALVRRRVSVLSELLPGYRVRILDRNCLAKTEHRSANSAASRPARCTARRWLSSIRR
jgi:hypothetical protein